tara:strand:+ start:585 stop:887 length:303 start_codon:yes stop_codon:yes gene_type:complete
MIKSVTKTEIKEAVAFAISLKEYRLEDGSFNWDWIETDVYTKVLGDVSQDERDEDKFDQYFDEVLFEIPPSLRPSYHWDIRKASSWSQDQIENLTYFLQH